LAAGGESIAVIGVNVRNQSVWIVEDNIASRTRLASYYRSRGWHVRSIADLKSAIRILKDIGDGDLVILDMQLPLDNEGASFDPEGGWLIAARLRAAGSKARLIRLVPMESMDLLDRQLGIINGLETEGQPGSEIGEPKIGAEEMSAAARRYLEDRDARIVRVAAASLGIMILGFVETDGRRQDSSSASIEVGQWFCPALQQMERAAKETHLINSHGVWLRVGSWREWLSEDVRQAGMVAASKLDVFCHSILAGGVRSGKAGKLLAMRAAEAFIVLFRLGHLNFGDEDPWNLRRMSLNHNKLGQLEMAWTDRARRIALFRHLRRPEDLQAFGASEYWNNSFATWPKLEKDLLELAASMGHQYRPLAPAEEALQATGGEVEDSIKKAHDYLARMDRYGEWSDSVRERICKISDLVSSLTESLPRQRLASRIRTDGLDLQQLGAEIRSLRGLVSGRGYFNHGTGD
jgi:CheY-like chemotaxis protein